MKGCKEVTRLLSESQDRKLGLAERLGVGMHLAVCKGCRNARDQMDFLHTACRRYIDRARGDEKR